MTTTHAHQPQIDLRSAPRWAVGGGLGILIGGVLLLIATVIESGLPGGGASGLLPAFSALFLGSTVSHAVAMLPLALGSTGSNGITGSHVLGTTALLSFGAVFLANQTVYYAMTYGGGGTSMEWLPMVLGVVQLLLLMTAAVVVLRAHVATGAARWALAALAAVATVTGVVATASEDAVTITVALISSTVAQIIVGVTLLLVPWRRAGGEGAPE